MRDGGFTRLLSPGGPGGRGLVLERLAFLHEARGDAEAAAGFHALLAELWADADPRLRERADFARERVGALVRER